MKIFISGAHRSGKTTLAKELATFLNLNYLDADVSGILKSLNVAKPNDNVESTDSVKHAANQLAIAKALVDKFNTNDNFVTDRSLLDVNMYTMYAIEKQIAEKGTFDKTYLPVVDFLREHMESDDLNIIVQPSIDVEFTHADKSGAQSSQSHLNQIVTSSRFRTNNSHILDVSISGVEPRVQAVVELMKFLSLQEKVKKNFR